MRKGLYIKTLGQEIHDRGGRHTGFEGETKLARKRNYGKKKESRGPGITYTSQWGILQGSSNPNDEGLLSGLEPAQIARVGIGI